jgi:DNA polymerase-1
MSKWLFVDGFNLAYRCFHALPELTSSKGLPTGALHGWVKSLWKLIDQEKPDATLVFFDLGESQDRLALLKDYKAQRKPMPDPLRQQIEPIKQLTRAMGLAGIEQDGVESDDLLASEAVKLAQQGHEVLIVSSDKDFAQIVDDRIKIMLPPPSANPKLGWRLLDAAGVQEKFGVPPTQIAHYLALVGDTSDNIPGLDGVGPKTAAKWLADCGGSVECVLEKAAELKPERFREAVVANAERLRMNLKLTTLNLHLPEVKPEWRSPQPEELFRLLDEFEMRTTGVEARKRYGHAANFTGSSTTAPAAPMVKPQKAEQTELF